MRRMLQRLLVMTSAFVCLFLFFDCGQAQQEERAPEGVIYREKRVPSVIVTDQENSFLLGPTLLAPTIVRANEDFKIEFNTIGGSCVRKGGDDVIVLGNVATVKAYDLASGQRRCNLVLQYLTHTVTLRFTKSDKAAIKIFGMREGNDTRLRRGAQIVMEHRLTVTEAEVKPKFVHFPGHRERRIRPIVSDASLVRSAERPPGPSPRPNFKANSTLAPAERVSENLCTQKF